MTNLDDAFDGAVVPEGGKRLPAGDYTGTVTNVQYQVGDDTWKPWVDSAIEVQLTTADGKVTTQWELSPCVKKDGTINSGWMGILKKNLRNLGYEGKLSALNAAVMGGQFHGTMADFSIVDTAQDKINEKTGEPYVDRTVYVNELVEAGLATANGLAAVDTAALATADPF